MSQKSPKKRGRVKLPKVGKRTLKNAFELEIYKGLKNLLHPKAKLEYETEKIPYTIEHVYEPDFPITRPDGTKLYIEAKGNGRAWTSQVQRKMLEVRRQNPELDIRIIFYSDGSMGQRRKNGSFKRQSDWATEHGFKFSIRKIPKEWLDE